MFDILGFSKCPRCANRELYFGDSQASYLELFAPPFLRKRWYMICAKPDDPEHGCEEDVDTTLILLPGELPKKVIQRIDVEYDQDLEKPLKFSLNKGGQIWLEICKVKALVRLADRHFPDEDTSLSVSPFGIYIVEVENGDCMIEAQPHVEADGTKDWNTTEWYLIGMEPCYRDKEGRFVMPTDGSLTLADGAIPGPTNYNYKAYQIFFRLEPQLRYLVSSVLESKYKQDHGGKWWEAIMPKDIVEQAGKARQDDLQNPLLIFKELHPICYTSFAHLRVIIDKKWEDFRDILLHKNVILADLQKLEFFRNTIAHNRPIEKKEYRELEYISSKFRGVLIKAKKYNKL